MAYLRATLTALLRLRTWREVVLTIGAVLGVLCIAMVVASSAFGVKALVFRSGSMSPAISTGALAFAKEIPASEVRVDDVVSVDTASGTRVTHRVTAVERSDNITELTLKGDANDAPDAESYPVASVDRVIFHVPKAGYVVSAASSRIGVFVGGLLVGCLFLTAFFPRRPKSGGKRRAGTPAALVLGLAVAGAPYSTTSTQAAFTDTAAVTGSFAARTLAAPTSPTCVDKGGVLGLLGYVAAGWNNIDERYRYKAIVIDVATGQAVGSPIFIDNPGASSSTVSKDFTMGLLNLGLGAKNYDIRIYSTVTGSSTWTSVSYMTIPVRTVSLVIVGLSLRCR
jgi:signal peptidase I